MMEDERTLNPNMDIVLRLFDFSGGIVFVGFGEGVYSGREWVSPLQNASMTARWIVKTRSRGRRVGSQRR